MNEMNKYQRFALNHFLSNYPQELDFDGVLDLIEAEDDAVLVWQPFENMKPEELVEEIDSMVTSLKATF
jgi:hypothetical protein